MLGARTPPHSLGTAGCRWPPPACGRRARRGTENTCSRASLAAAAAATGAVSDSCELAGADTEWEFGRVLFSEPDIKDRLLVRAPATRCALVAENALECNCDVVGGSERHMSAWVPGGTVVGLWR